jgi:hypothetical protein
VKRASERREASHSVNTQPKDWADAVVERLLRRARGSMGRRVDTHLRERFTLSRKADEHLGALHVRRAALDCPHLLVHLHHMRGMVMQLYCKSRLQHMHIPGARGRDRRTFRYTPRPFTAYAVSLMSGRWTTPA